MLAYDEDIRRMEDALRRTIAKIHYDAHIAGGAELPPFQEWFKDNTELLRPAEAPGTQLLRPSQETQSDQGLLRAAEEDPEQWQEHGS